MVGLVEVRGRIGDRETGIMIGERGGVEKGFRVVREEGGGGEGERRGGFCNALQAERIPGRSVKVQVHRPPRPCLQGAIQLFACTHKRGDKT